MSGKESFLATGGALGGRLAARLMDERERETELAIQQRVGTRIGSYELRALLGSGGMGHVYLAERVEDKFTQQVALKLVREGLMTATARERFEQERQILADLVHPHIAALLDVGQTSEGLPYYTMEYVDGQPLSTYCRENQPSVEERVRLLMQVAEALAHAHRNLVVHRDIKPSNILVRADGVAKLVDFGIAKLVIAGSESNLTLGAAGPMTPEYAAPEQFRNESITVATDVYQFGMLCYRVLTGNLPYRAEPSDTLAWSRAVAEHEPLMLSRALTSGSQTWGASANLTQARRRLTRDLDAVVRKALAKVPATRYGSMDAVVADLNAYLEGRPVAARRAGPLYFLWRSIARRPYTSAIATAAVLGLVTTTFMALHQARVAEQEATRAKAEAERANTAVSFLTRLFEVADPGVNRGERLTANEILQRGAERIDRDLSSQPAMQANLLRTIGDVYTSLGEYERSLTPYRRAIALLRQQGPGAAEQLSAVMVEMARSTRIVGRAQEAVTLLDDAAKLIANVEVRDPLLLVRLYFRRGSAYTELERKDLAAADLRRALDVAEGRGLDDTLEAGMAHDAFGTLYRRDARLVEAMAEFQKAREIKTHAVGTDHPSTLQSMGNIGVVLLELGRFADARAVLVDTRDTYIRLLGASHRTVAQRDFEIGETYRNEGKLTEAKASFESARATFVQVGDTVGAASATHAIGKITMRQGHFGAALPLIDEALETVLAAGARPTVVATLRMSRTRALLGLNRDREAEQEAAAALALLSPTVKPSHPHWVETLYLLGLAEHRLGQAEPASGHWQEALQWAAEAYVSNPAAVDGLRRDMAASVVRLD